MRTIAITSGKGGVGKSSLTVNLGVCMANLGLRAVVFDADLALANLEVLLGVRPEHTLQDVVAGTKTINEVVKKCPGGLGLIAGGSGIPTLARSGPKKLNLFFEQINGLASDTDVLLLDTAAGLDSRVMAFIKQADDVIVVTTPDPASVTDAYATIKAIYRNKPTASIRIVVNMVKDQAEAQQVFDILSTITHDFLKKDVSLAGFVRHDPAVVSGGRQRSPVCLHTGQSVAKADITSLAASLVEVSEGLPKSA
ncbi:MAG: MinD/ParA family protein [Chthonomonadaceae bacterium]|nr:MinD/ParA family protein [Chthonomonadaceae bacterium]